MGYFRDFKNLRIHFKLQISSESELICKTQDDESSDSKESYQSYQKINTSTQYSKVQYMDCSIT